MVTQPLQKWANAVPWTVASPSDEDITKTLQVYTVTRPCSSAKTISKESVRQYSHLKNVSDKIHLSGGAIDLLIGTDFVEAFIDIHTVSGEPGEPIGKRNCFGWYVLGQFESSGSTLSEIQETIGADQIRYIKSNNNPADALTRGIHLNHLMKWSEGPSFLELPEEKWPSAQDHTRVNTHVDDLDALREKKTFRKEKKAGKHHSAAAEVCPELDQPGSEENPILLHLLKTCSTYSKIRRTLAYVGRNAWKMNPKSGPISLN